MLTVRCRLLPLAFISSWLGLASWAVPPAHARLVYGETGRLDSFDPYTVHEASGHRLADLLFDSLIDIGPGHTYQGGLASSWEVSADGTYITVNLRPNVSWHPHPQAPGDHKFGPDDIITTIALLTAPGSDIPNQDRFRALSHAQAVGRNKVMIHLKHAMTDPLRLLSFKVLPAFLLKGSKILKRDSEFSYHPIGTGPYQFVKASNQGELLLKANRSYFKGQPKIDPIVMKTYTDQNIMSQSLMFHSLDLVTSVSPRNLPEIVGDEALSVVPYDALSYSFIGMNTSRGPLQDKRVRQALSYAINREEMLAAFFNNKGSLISGPFPPSSWAYNLDVKGASYDPQRAAALLAAAGLSRAGEQGPLKDQSGRKVELEFAVPISGESELIKRIVLAYQGYLDALGITCRLKFMEWSVWKRKVIGEHDYDLTIAAWNFDDASNIQSLFHSSHAKPWGNNFVAYRNDEVDTLLSEAALTNDSDKRRAIYHKLHHILADEAPYTYLWTLKHHAAHHMRLSGIKVEPFAFFKYITSWALPERQQESL